MFSFRTDAARPGSGRSRSSFANPIAPGADPWVVQHEGYYYWCASEKDLGVAVYRSSTLTSQGEKFMVWRAAERGPYSAQVWAPELHRLDGRWYIYVAASDGRNEMHRMIVLESSGADPTDPFHFKAELYTGDDFARHRNNRWAIDGTVLEHQGSRYLLWSGWHDGRDEQWLYIAPMANPWTLSGPRVRLCENDDFGWERVGESRRERGLNEGPQVLQRNGRTFVVYSCSGSWEPSYKLGMLELAPHGDPLDPYAWRKQAAPVLESSKATCGVGHCSFTQSPDGTEDWIVFHAKVSRAHGWTRVIHAQRFTWDDDGRPVFGPVIDANVLMPRPSGELPETVAVRARRLVTDVQVRNVADGTDERVTV
jgi:GH43 family beta-xylosidase